MTPSITLLGPQRRPTLDRVLSSLSVGGPVAVVNAGWQERESDDAEILALAGRQATNLRLFARWMDVLRADPEYAAAEREHRLVLDELQQLYLIRLDHALRAVSAVAARPDGHANTQAMALEDGLAAVRLLDATHVARVQELHAASFGTPEDAWAACAEVSADLSCMSPGEVSVTCFTTSLHDRAASANRCSTAAASTSRGAYGSTTMM